MRPFITLIYAAAFGLVTFSASALPPGNRSRMYDRATEITLKGTVQRVNQSELGWTPRTHLAIESGGAMIEVALGPTAFLENRGFAFVKGDQVEVTGSKMTVRGTEFVIAREITRGGKSLTLRDKNGIPVWAEQRRRARPVY